MPEQEKRTTNIAIRATIEGIIEILGENAAKILFRIAGLSYLLENKPEYNFDPCITIPEQASIYNSIADLLGFTGAMGVWRRIGYTVLKYAHQYGGVLDAFNDLPPDEKFERSMEVFILGSGKGRIAKTGDGPVDFDCFDCIHCKGYTMDRPMCTHYEGFVQYLADFAYGKNIYRARETECKALGASTCYFKLEKRE
ncbi:MAG: 4-vinyl reductase [Deltaproteobacteria bacterium]|nr:4-vinyl reductase [Candidatus Zymogenaceae bacterium]